MSEDPCRSLYAVLEWAEEVLSVEVLAAERDPEHTWLFRADVSTQKVLKGDSTRRRRTVLVRTYEREHVVGYPSTAEADGSTLARPPAPGDRLLVLTLRRAAHASLTVPVSEEESITVGCPFYSAIPTDAPTNYTGLAETLLRLHAEPDVQARAQMLRGVLSAPTAEARLEGLRTLHEVDRSPLGWSMAVPASGEAPAEPVRVAPLLFDTARRLLQSDPDPRVRAAALYHAGRLYDERVEAADPLVEALQTDADSTVRAAAARALGYRVPPGSQALIETARDSRHPLHVREAALRSLAVGNVLYGSYSLFLIYQRESDERLRRAVLLALGPILRVDDLPELRTLYEATSPESYGLRPAIVELASTLRTPESAHFAASILVAESDSLPLSQSYWAAVEALGEIGERRYAPLLMRRFPSMCEDAARSYPDVLFRAVQQLTAAESALGLLVPFLECERPRTRLAAAEAISYIHRPDALTTLERWQAEQTDYARMQSDTLLWRLRDALRRMPPLPGE